MEVSNAFLLLLVELTNERYFTSCNSIISASTGILDLGGRNFER